MTTINLSTLDGVAAGDRSGYSVSGAGDMNLEKAVGMSGVL
jgi:hypothetical protein